MTRRREDQLLICHGIAYQQCGRRAVWVVSEIYRHGYWHSMGMCTVHARYLISWRASETDPAPYLVWQDVQDYAQYGLPIETTVDWPGRRQ